MDITVHYFAGHREITGRASEQLVLEQDANAGTLWEELTARYPALAPFSGRVLYAVNQEFATPDTVLRDGDEVVFLPPVSGG